MTGLLPVGYGSRRLAAARADRATTTVSPYAGPPQTISVLPQVVNLLLYQGDTVTLQLVCTDETGQPSNLSAAVALAQIRPFFDSEVVAEFAASITDNVITLVLSHADSTGLGLGRGVWDCQVSENGDVTTLVAGDVTVMAEVSR